MRVNMSCNLLVGMSYSFVSSNCINDVREKTKFNTVLFLYLFVQCWFKSYTISVYVVKLITLFI